MLWFFKTEQLLVGIGIGQLYASSSMAIEPRPATQHITSEPVSLRRKPLPFGLRGPRKYSKTKIMYVGNYIGHQAKSI